MSRETARKRKPASAAAEWQERVLVGLDIRPLGGTGT
jgi:hypothetical protein